MKRIWLCCIAFLSLLALAGSKPLDVIRFTVVNKSGMEIAIQLRGQDQVCMNCAETKTGQIYYLPVLEGDRDTPVEKTFVIERATYGMQLYYLETWDPVYGFKCGTPRPNALLARRNLRLTVLPCDFTPGNVGEPGMRKYLPYPIPQHFRRYWITRVVY